MLGHAPPHRDDVLWNTIQVPGSWEEQGYGEEPGYARIDTWTKIREYEGQHGMRRMYMFHMMHRTDTMYSD